MKKGDRMLIIGIVIIAIVALLFIKFQENGQGSQIQITVDGEVFGTYSLNNDQIIEINQENGYNRVYIHSQKVYMEEADCPDRYCVHQGSINRENETIVCLPHKLVVEVIKSGKSSYDLPDAVAK